MEDKIEKAESLVNRSVRKWIEGGPYHDWQRRIVAATKKAQSDPTEYGVEMFMAGIEYAAHSTMGLKGSESETSTHVRLYLKKESEERARYWNKQTLEPITESKWRSRGMLDGIDGAALEGALWTLDRIHTNYANDDLLVWHLLDTVRIAFQHMLSKYDHLYPSMPDRTSLFMDPTLGGDIDRMLRKRIDAGEMNGGRMLATIHDDVAMEAVREAVNTNLLITNGRYSTPAIKKALETLLDFSNKQMTSKSDEGLPKGMSTCDARDIIMFAGHAGFEPNFVGVWDNGGTVVRYERDDRCVDVMFGARMNFKGPKDIHLSLCESGTPIITLSATSDEEVLATLKRHLRLS